MVISPQVPQNEAVYEQLVQFLDQLIDQVGEDETHPLASLWTSSVS
jgi:HTH-type transcriptional regulator / antitoxin HigA